MPFRSPTRLSYVLAGVLAGLLAAGVTLTVASCGQLTPLGPDPAATLPQPHQLRSPLVVQAVSIEQPTPSGGCPAGSVALPAAGNPAMCYRPAGTPVTITSAAASSISPFRPPPPPGQPPVPVQYGFWITLPAADAPALTAVITTVAGPQRPQGPPVASAATAALTISVAGRTWFPVGFGIGLAGRQLQVDLSSRNQALQLQRMLAPST